MIHATHTHESNSNPLPVPVASGHDHSGASHAEERVTSGGLAASQDGYTLLVEERTVPTGAIQPLHFRIVGPDGATATRFTPQHEHDLHAVVIRSDLQHFQHLHPVRDADGRWTLPLALPEGGSYRLLADFISEGKELVLGTNLFAAGQFTPEPLPPITSSVEVNGYRVTLDRPARLVPGQGAHLRFTITRPDGKYVALKPLMGTLGHLVALREGDLAYLHAHPMTTAEVKAGPDASVAFHLGVPSVGRYRLFLQFAEGGRISTVAFTVEVPPISIGTAKTSAPHTAHSHAVGSSSHH